MCLEAESTGCDCQGDWRGENYFLPTHWARYKPPSWIRKAPARAPNLANVILAWKHLFQRRCWSNFRGLSLVRAFQASERQRSHFLFSGDCGAGLALFRPSYVCTNHIYATLGYVCGWYLRLGCKKNWFPLCAGTKSAWENIKWITLISGRMGIEWLLWSATRTWMKKAVEKWV